MLERKDWDKLSELIYEKRSILRSDPVILHALKIFEQEFIGHVRALNAQDRILKLKHISLIIEFDRNSFAVEFVNEAIDVKLVALHEVQSNAFPGYAARYIDRPLAVALLNRTKLEHPEKIVEARRPFVTIKAGFAGRSNAQKTIELFKSDQEQNFYSAVKTVFPHYFPYPNVAVSAVIDFDAIKQSLSTRARDYFYKSMFDCVIFDPEARHVPIHFFELDSSFHDTAKAKLNDRLKNEICQIANVKLIRIRAYDASDRTVEAFADLVRELLLP